MKLLLILLMMSSMTFAGVRKECRKSAREYCAGFTGKDKRKCKRSYRRDCRKKAGKGKDQANKNENCGFNYSSNYPKGKTCIIQHTSSTIKPTKKFFTNCSSCTEAAVKKRNGQTSIESPIYQVSMLICKGKPKLNKEITTEYSFKITDNSGKSAFFSYKKSKCTH